MTTWEAAVGLGRNTIRKTGWGFAAASAICSPRIGERVTLMLSQSALNGNVDSSVSIGKKLIVSRRTLRKGK